MQGTVRVVLVAVLVLLLGACSPPSGNVPSEPSLSATGGAERPAGAPVPQLPRLTEPQARAAAVVVAFLDAYNAGSHSSALALLTDDVLVSDCDYGRRERVIARGKKEASAWLQSRIADHDRFVIGELSFGEPNSLGLFAVAVSYQRRSSDTLQRLGFREGIKPLLATKAVVTESGDRLRVFNNGPGESATIGACEGAQG